jgi:CxxC motif-containing protein
METRIMNCINCPMGCELTVTVDEHGKFVSVTGNTCPRGAHAICSQASDAYFVTQGETFEKVKSLLESLAPAVTGLNKLNYPYGMRMIKP